MGDLGAMRARMRLGDVARSRRSSPFLALSYCPAEQTGGRVLKDRRLSWLLKWRRRASP